MGNAAGKVLGLINNLPRHVLDRVGAVLMGSVDGDCGINEVRYGAFSGTLVRAEVPRNVPVSIRGSSDMYKKHGIGKLIDIESITLSDLINEYAIDDNDAVLKMDCEGCEYEAILKVDLGDLTVFGPVIIEYHNGYESLRKRFENAGFEITIKLIRSAKVSWRGRAT